ncbi:UbiA prenyltransferase family [Mycena vitilis]|nr:UbiA prenyltransferase family [Mycena vitilis]
MSAFDILKYHLHTLLLFTWTDYKTIFLPVTVFACATAPVSSLSKFLQGEAWIWLHLLMCNVSNQAYGEEEDMINRPWRPIPSKRVTKQQVRILRWATVFLCLLLSAFHGPEVVYASLGLFLTTFLYDEAGLAAHVIGKNFCNIGGYTTFELGATMIMGDNRLDLVSLAAVALSGILIFTTIQAQDFPDVEGDAALGRVTFPIYAPEGSRLFTLIVMIFWPIVLAHHWDIGRVSTSAFLALGAYVGWRYYHWRTRDADRKSYLIFNGWLMFAHILPLHARMGAFFI